MTQPELFASLKPKPPKTTKYPKTAKSIEQSASHAIWWVPVVVVVGEKRYHIEKVVHLDYSVELIVREIE